MVLPVDYESLIYSQKQLDLFFSREDASPKRLIISQKYGKECLKVVHPKDLSPPNKLAAWLWGAGPAGFKKVMEFCVDRCLSHKNLKLMIQTYNQQHAGEKRVSEAVRKILKKHVCSPLVRAVEQQNVEVLKALLREMSWLDARVAFIDDKGSDRGLLIQACRPKTANPTVINFLIEFINSKASPNDFQVIYSGKDCLGRTASFLLALDSANLLPASTEFMKSGLNAQDVYGKTPLMTIFDHYYTVDQMKSLLALKPDMTIEDLQGNNVLFHSYRSLAFDLISQKNALLIATIKEFPKEFRTKLTTPFFAKKDGDGRNEYQKLRPGIDASKGKLLMNMKKAFKWHGEGWEERDGLC